MSGAARFAPVILTCERRGWRAALAAATATWGFPPWAYHEAGRVGWPGPDDMTITPTFLALAAGIQVAHLRRGRPATGAQRRRQARLQRRIQNQHLRWAKRTRAACAAAGVCWECHAAPADYACPVCRGTRLATPAVTP